jgi:hypothetical protein
VSLTRLRVARPSRLLRRRRVLDAADREVGRIEGPWHESFRAALFILAVFAAHSLGKPKLVLPLLLVGAVYLWLRPRGLSARFGKKTAPWKIRTGWWIRDGSRWWVHGPRGSRWLWTPGRRIFEQSLRTTHTLVAKDDEWSLRTPGGETTLRLRRGEAGEFELSWDDTTADPARELAFAAAILAR